ncbi:mechanosensitive ion channel [Lusitaniella coriacea LEGE 07157]|uniref:Mechanosensitive ion channel n=1 Tax=Lusitaniella coriacea LEGE 07157 TaxID=945747 RepID=A0A8J7J6V3_9CYAN|nr:mechanosensitive ion channel domain-containing protein [Lusitaniella coriacea]MBE9118969.1 mechanosensitive ion channel [Lusitaniella coriacea LEGE 07157]
MANKRSIFQRPIRFVAIAVFVLGACCLWADPFGIAILPAIAQDKATTAPIIVDSRRILEVSNSDDYEAEKRVEQANEILQEKVGQENVSVIVKQEVVEADEPGERDEEKTVPVLWIDNEKLEDQRLFTVTFADAPEGKDPNELAAEWAAKIEKALDRAHYERSREYIIKAILLSLTSIAMAIFLSWSLGRVWEHWVYFLTHRETDEDAPFQSHHRTLERLAQVLLVVVRVALAFAALIYISQLFPQTYKLSQRLVDALIVSFTSEAFPLGGKSFSVLDLLRLIGLFALLIALARVFKRLLRSRILSLTGLSRAAQETIAVISNYTFIFIGTIVVLQLWGLELSSLTVFAGVLGVGIGLGVQGIAKEFMSGLVIIFERPVQVGDFVEIGDLMGTVEHISVRSTTILTLDRISVILPNSRFLEAEVINWSHRSPVSRLKIPVGVAYGSPLETVQTILLDAAKEHRDVLSQPPPYVLFTGFGDSSLDFELMVWIIEPTKQFRIKSDLYFLIEAQLRDRGVEIPFPQRDLHVRSGSLPEEQLPSQLADSLAHLSEKLAQWLHHQTQNGNGQIPLEKGDKETR